MDPMSATIETISAITLATHDMARSVAFYRALGFELVYGGPDAAFTSFRVGEGYLNITGEAPDRQWSWWGRVIFHVSDVDALYDRALGNGCTPRPRPAMPSGERGTSTSPTRTATS